MTTTDTYAVPDTEDGLDGAVAVVTGAARGNGKAQAEVLADAGAHVFVTDVLVDQGRDVADTITTADGGDATFHELDVTSENDWEELVSEIEAEHGQLDVLVNNAGIVSEATVVDEDREGWETTLDVNLTGPWLGMKHCIPLMEETGGGSVVNISSVYAVRGGYGGGAAAYQASKGGVTALTKNAMQAFAARGVRINSVHPGYIETPMTAGNEELSEGFIADTPQARAGQPAEVARAVYFLASDLASYVNGSELYVDGGWSN